MMATGVAHSLIARLDSMAFKSRFTAPPSGMFAEIMTDASYTNTTAGDCVSMAIDTLCACETLFKERSDHIGRSFRSKVISLCRSCVANSFYRHLADPDWVLPLLLHASRLHRIVACFYYCIFSFFAINYKLSCSLASRVTVL